MDPSTYRDPPTYWMQPYLLDSSYLFPDPSSNWVNPTYWIRPVRLSILAGLIVAFVYLPRFSHLAIYASVVFSCLSDLSHLSSIHFPYMSIYRVSSIYLSIGISISSYRLGFPFLAIYAFVRF